MTKSQAKEKVSKYLEGIGRYLYHYRVRESLTQNEMAQRLELSLNRYREYEQNTTDNTKGIALDLLIKVSELEGRSLGELVALIEDVKPAKPENSKIDTLSSQWVDQFEMIPLEERKELLFLVSQKTEELNQNLIQNRMRWMARVGILLFKMDYEQRIKFEREILEEFIKSYKFPSGENAQEPFLDRLRELVKHYFTNFDTYKR